MVNDKLFSGTYNGKRVLITGHTGFKGSWLALWLKKMGAIVSGISLAPNTDPSHWELLDLGVDSHIMDIRDLDLLKKTMKSIDPEIVFHLAAQPIVRLSYREPYDTYTTNIMGAINLFEVVRHMPSIKAVVIVTSDKCYDNKEWVWGYREDEAMGGSDPYSCSKGCIELITESYRKSFFNGKDCDTLVASARAGNVIGGGDWAQDRIVTDIVLATTKSKPIFLRNPNATRPWQYVLEPLSGYLALGEKLLKGERKYAEAWNFGPNHESNVSVRELVLESAKSWSTVTYEVDSGEHPPEANFLMLDSSKAMRVLKWVPVWGFAETVENTIGWYRNFYEKSKISSEDILSKYIQDAQRKKIKWSI